MANKEISGLTAAAALDGSEITIASQGGNSRKVLTSALGVTLPMVPTGAPGTGSFTPSILTRGVNNAQMRSGMCGLFRFDDGSAWEVRWGFYTGSVITRPTNGFVASSTGSGLSLSAAAIATMLSPLGLFQRGRGEHIFGVQPVGANSANLFSQGTLAPTALGTAGGAALADTNLFTRQQRNLYTSATTANANGGFVGQVPIHSRNQGLHLAARFGASQLPTAPRVTIGWSLESSSSVVEPSTLPDLALFAKDSTDTNLQFMVNDNAGAATKSDTSIAFAINTWYEAAIWCDPAGTTMFGLLADYTNQALWYGSAGSNLPTAGTLLYPRVNGALNGTNTGTAIIFHFGGLYIRSGI